MADMKVQYICIKFYFKLKKNAMGTFENVKVCFGEQTVGRTYISEWFSKVKSCVIFVKMLNDQDEQNI
jgi:hypothetical protein